MSSHYSLNVPDPAFKNLLKKPAPVGKHDLVSCYDNSTCAIKESFWNFSPLKKAYEDKMLLVHSRDPGVQPVYRSRNDFQPLL